MDDELPVIVYAARSDVLLAEWVNDNLAWVGSYLREHGAILLRGFKASSQADFEAFVDALVPHRLQYLNRTDPRSAVGEGIYTVDDCPAQLQRVPRSEGAHQRDWPESLVLYCQQPPQRGGEATLASVERVTARLDPELVDLFATRGVRYVRNLGSNDAPGWESVFQTTSPEAVERYCQAHGIDFEWRRDGGLRVQQVCQGVVAHPVTGQRLWFNQAHLLHISAVDPRTRAVELRDVLEEDLPTAAYFGDGAPIPAAMIATVRQAFLEEALPLTWCRGDVLIVDNLRVALGRMPFSGPRRLLMAMSGSPLAAGQP